MFVRRGLLLAVLGLGALIAVFLGLNERETKRVERAISIARSARFGPARVRLEQVLKNKELNTDFRWSVPDFNLWGRVMTVKLDADNNQVFIFEVDLKTKQVAASDRLAHELIGRAEAVPQPGSQRN